MSADVILIIGGVLAGGAIGSFLGCAWYRVPRGLSLTKNRSACPACHHQLTPTELIPVISFILQKGRAKCCNARLSHTYFYFEFLCATLGGIMAYAAV